MKLLNEQELESVNGGATAVEYGSIGAVLTLIETKLNVPAPIANAINTFVANGITILSSH